MMLNHAIYEADSFHRKERVHDEEKFQAAIELFQEVYDMWYRRTYST